MNEVWKKPPVSFEAYQGMVGKEIGVSSWHLVDQVPGRHADLLADHGLIGLKRDRRLLPDFIH